MIGYSNICSGWMYSIILHKMHYKFGLSSNDCKIHTCRKCQSMSMEKERTVTSFKHYLRRENKANKKQGIIVSWYAKMYANIYALSKLKAMKKGVFLYEKLTNQLSFKTFPPKLDQHTGGKWLIHGTKHCKNNQLQSLELPGRLS